MGKGPTPGEIVRQAYVIKELLKEVMEKQEEGEVEESMKIDEEVQVRMEEFEAQREEFTQQSQVRYSNRIFAETYFRWRVRQDITSESLAKRIIKMFASAGLSTGLPQDIGSNELIDGMDRMSNKALENIKVEDVKGDVEKEEAVIQDMASFEELFGFLFRSSFDGPIQGASNKEIGLRILLMVMMLSDE